MSQESVEIVRQPIVLKGQSYRGLEERLALRFPRVATRVMRAVLALPPRSWLRRTMIRRVLQRIFDAANRKDFESAFALSPPDAEHVPPPDAGAIGFDPVYYGSQGRIRLQRMWEAELGDFRNEPEEVIDLGDRLLLLGRMKGSGRSSGAVFDNEVAYLFSFSRGRFIREQFFRSHAQGLDAAGLSE